MNRCLKHKMHGKIKVSFEYSGVHSNGYLMTTLSIGSHRNEFLHHIAFSYCKRSEHKMKHYETRSFSSRFKYK